MSAYIVEDETINRIVTALQDGDGHGDNPPVPVPPDILKVMPAGMPSADAHATAVGRSLLIMNAKAVCERYVVAANVEPVYFYRFRRLPVTPTEVYKATRCLIYQCAEGDVPNSEIFKALEEYAGELAQRIVKRSPEYDAAPWG